MVVSKMSFFTDSPSSKAADLHEAIRRRAEEIYLESGRIPGRDTDNWTQAEREVMERFSTRRTAIVVKVGGVQYVGEYKLEEADGYVPGEFAAGTPVPVRFEGDKMFVRRHDGRELRTTIVKKVG